MSLYEQMRKDGHRSLKIDEIGYKVSFLEDIKAGIEPKKKHKTLDQFIK